MLSSSIYLALPRRIVVLTLLFGMGAVIWVIFTALLAMQSLVQTTALDAHLTGARRYGIRVREAMVNGSPEETAETLDSIRSEGNFAYCAVVGPDGFYLAHTERGRSGKEHLEPTGEADERFGLAGTKYRRAGVDVIEYRLPLRNQETTLGSLRIGVASPTIGSVLKRSAGFLPLLAVAPFLFVISNSFLLQRMLNPISELDQQVRRAVSAATIADAQFESIASSTATGAGWNQIVSWLQAANNDSGLGTRLASAMSSMQQERSTDVLNSLSEGIAVTDDHGAITLTNNALSVLLTGQADHAAVHGKKLTDLLEVESFDPNSILLDPSCDSRAVAIELDRSTPEGESILRVSRNPIRTAEGANANGHAWVVRDITQQKLSDRMRDQFLDSATHELRTPLSNIRAYAETLACMDEIDVESQKTFCNTINTEATRLARFIDDLLSISSMEVGSMSLTRSNCDIERVLTEAVSKISGQAEQKGIVVETVLPPKYPKMKLDKDKFQIALVNLLGNAVKYTPDGGNVTLRVKVSDASIQIEIEDTGVGISEEELPRVFDKFFRSQSDDVQSITGTGLGLSMTQEIIRLHGGELSATSTLGEGSTFILTVPLDRTD